jgi:DNA processing protein
VTPPPPTRDDHDVVCATAIASLGLSPARLRRLLAGRTPSDAWAGLSECRDPGDRDADLAGSLTPALWAEAAAQLARSRVGVRVLGFDDYPRSLASDQEAPAVLFAAGDLRVLSATPRVAIVGTRSASPTGCAVAAELGRELSATGVSVVSGLASGIDAAAHRGALEPVPGAPPVGVLGTALGAPAALPDGALRAAVEAAGVVISEVPPGTSGTRWRFAVRNRIMAALAHVVVVVECHERGGALHTVVAARKRDRVVAAVPGSVRSAASAGTNALLVEGAPAVRHAGDVLDLLTEVTGLDPRGAPARGGWPARFGARPASVRGGIHVPSRTAAQVRRVLDLNPASLAVVVERAGLPVGEVALALEQLADAGLAAGGGGWWSLPPA